MNQLFKVDKNESLLTTNKLFEANKMTYYNIIVEV